MLRSIRSFLILTLLVVATSAVPALVTAQTYGPINAPTPPVSETQEKLAAEVDALAAKLADIEKQVDVSHPSETILNKLSTEILPLTTEAQTIVDRITPRTAAIKARLDQLGPKGASDSDDVTKERITLQKTFDLNDGLLKRAKVLEVKAQQDSTFIGKRQRTLFTNSLFQRSTSLLSPPLWFTIIKDSPGNVADISRVFNQWIVAFNENLTGGKLIAFWLLVAAVLLLYWPLTRAAKRLIRHESKVEDPTGWQKILVACWTCISVSALMVAIMYAVVYVFSFFTVADPTVMPLFTAIQTGVIRIAIAAGLARGILAPDRPKWRLVNLDEKTVDKLTRIVVGVAIIVSGTKIIESLNDVITTSIEFSVAARGVGALLMAAALAAALIDLGDDPEAGNPDAASSVPSQKREWYGLVRGVAWALILVVTVAVLVGYSPFASFLVDQIVLVAGVGSVLYLLVSLVDEACEIGFKPGSIVGRNLIYTIGMRRETLEQLAILLSGGARLALILVALLVVAAPWGMQSTDISGNLNAAFFGFKVGDVTISIAGIAVAIVMFLVVLAATRAVQNWLEDKYLPHTRLDSGLRNSIKTSLGYTGFLLALAVSAANLGVDFQKLAIVAGALSVGIGFGLQSIVNNFVSGLILLWERAVRVGDWVVVGSDQGYVRKINVRSTEIETFDRAAVIVPNSNLVSGVVKNLMRTDRVGRLTIELTVHASSDPEKVREVLIDIARDNDSILSLPSPQVRFTSLTAGAMTFDLFCFVADVESMARTKSDLYFEICKQFRQFGFFDGPAPDPTAINIVGLDRLEALFEAARQANPDVSRARKLG